ncbi:hypothetical protein [Streptomyces rapamycinicus]|uniref:hypothetical protein n=1 Tax=Streptomyces rapamycinicus TaxID=1226757 RepID=UPI0020C9EE30|nr:hypothetical protein [Streptomyces rapamycinicus]UTP36737.1 hypothetical protein LIV37_50280 [Streptomyces rapamycinicus NRRL 5491]
MAGLLDRTALDGMVADRPVRLQHRGGALWILNSAGLAAVAPALDDSLDVERDAAGQPTGRLWRYDVRLRAAIGAEPPDLASVGERLASYGITGVTDATPDLDAAGLGLIATAVHGAACVRRCSCWAPRPGHHSLPACPVGRTRFCCATTTFPVSRSWRA